MCTEWWLTYPYWNSHHSVRRYGWRNITALVITACGVKTEELLLHQSSPYLEWWLTRKLHEVSRCGKRVTQYYCISHHFLRSNAWSTITVSVINVGRVMTGELLLQQSSLCIEGWLVHSCCFSHQCVRSDDWWTLALSVINVCGVMTGALLLYQSSICVEWWVVHSCFISRQC